MLDRGMTADLLEEWLGMNEGALPMEATLATAVRSAMRYMREEAEKTLYTQQEVAAFEGALQAGAEIACYLEERGYYKPQGCVVYAMNGTGVFITTGDGHMQRLSLDDYNRKWRLWSKYPNGKARNQTAWAGARAN